jgi:hypothetical protein
MVSVEIGEFTFSLSDGAKRILIFKDTALADYYNYSTREEAEADFEKIKKCSKVTFESVVNKPTKAEGT